jgi:hypothetical protein
MAEPFTDAELETGASAAWNHIPAVNPTPAEVDRAVAAALRAVLPAHDARVRAQAGEDIAAFFDAWATATGQARRVERAVALFEIARIARQVTTSTTNGEDQHV